MATSERCSNCEKGAGICFCTGCKKYFCKKDFNNHREILNNELHGFIEDRNTLQEKITKATQQKSTRSPLLLQIDDWQKAMIENVEKAAEQARKHVMQMLTTKQIKVTSEFEKFSQELINLKETEDFVEPDLKRLKQTINQLDQDLQQLAQSPAIELHVEESEKVAWDRLIYVVEKTNYSAKQHQQPAIEGRQITTVPSPQQLGRN